MKYDDSEWTFVNYTPRFPSLSEVNRGISTGVIATGTITVRNNSFVFEAQRSEKWLWIRLIDPNGEGISGE